MDKNELLDKYFGVIGKIEDIGEIFEEKGYNAEQVTDIITVLVQEVPAVVFGKDDLEKIIHELEVRQMSFEEIETAVEKNKNRSL